MKLFADEGETWFPTAVTPEERAGLEIAAANAEHLSHSDLKNLIRIMGTLQEIDNQKADAIAEQEAIAEHYRQERAREINQALQVAETERQVRRARIADVLGIPVDEVPELK